MNASVRHIYPVIFIIIFKFISYFIFKNYLNQIREIEM